MLSIFKFSKYLILVLIGYWLGRVVPYNQYQEELGTIIATDSATQSYQVSLEQSTYLVYTKLPLPEIDKQIVILIPN